MYPISTQVQISFFSPLFCGVWTKFSYRCSTMNILGGKLSMIEQPEYLTIGKYFIFDSGSCS